MAGKVLVTGARGQLGIEMVRQLKYHGFNVYAFGKEELDVTNETQVFEKIKSVSPNAIIHCAAFTHVDLAESNPDQSFLVNAFGTRNIAAVAEEINAKLVYISTDYVFDGESDKPYTEFDQTNPINVYGKSKLAGERFVKDFHSRYFIVRTSWLYGHDSNNFVKTMLRLSKENDQLKVVSDQIGSPTYVLDLARMVVQLILTNKFGTYHVSNSGFCSRYEFAKAIFDISNVKISLMSCTSDEFPTPAKRPAYSVLDHMSLRLNGFGEMRDWRSALQEFLFNERVNDV